MLRHAIAVQAVALSLIASAAHAQEIPGAFKTGADLREICKEDSVYDDVCLGYLQGASDLLTVVQKPLWPFNYPYCPPAGATAQELREVLMTYLDSNPDKTPTIGAGSAFRALVEAFPCPKQAAFIDVP
jgi:hypothetical protein